MIEDGREREKKSKSVPRLWPLAEQVKQDGWAGSSCLKVRTPSGKRTTAQMFCSPKIAGHWPKKKRVRYFRLGFPNSFQTHDELHCMCISFRPLNILQRHFRKGMCVCVRSHQAIYFFLFEGVSLKKSTCWPHVWQVFWPQYYSGIFPFSLFCGFPFGEGDTIESPDDLGRRSSVPPEKAELL